MLKLIKAMGFSNVVCVFVLYGSLVTAFPTGDNDDVDLDLLGVPVEGTAMFSGTAPASGSCTIFGHSSPELLLDSNLPTPIASERDDVVIDNTEDDEAYTSINSEYNESDSNGRIPNKVILGAILADTIMAEKGVEIDATLAELDTFVETEIGKLEPLIQNALRDADTSAVDSCVDTALHEIETEISSKLAMVDEFIESELKTAQKLVESVIESTDQVNSHFEAAECLNNRNVTEITDISEKEALVALELAVVKSLIGSQLAKTESLIDCELEKVNSLIETELAKVDDIVESELAKVDLFVETELATTDELVKSELAKMESFVDTELAKVEAPIEETVKFCNVAPTSGVTTTIVVNSNYPSGLASSDLNIDETLVSEEDPIMSSVEINGTFPVTGRTLIFGSTGCPPILPTAEPLPLYVESYPVKETIQHDETYEPVLADEVLYYDDDTIEIPVVGEVVFSGIAPAEGSCKIVGVSACDPLINRNVGNPPMIGEANTFITKQVTGPGDQECFSLDGNTVQRTEPDAMKPQITILPMVNIKQRMPHHDPSKMAIIEGIAEFSGTVRATGRTSVYAQFPCAPLMATEEGPDGKKYIWISKKFNTGTPSKPAASRPKPDFPTYTPDFPETTIMDATKNYEKLMSEDLGVDFGVLGPIPVSGEVVFEGTAPAFGEVSIRGHSA